MIQFNLLPDVKKEYMKAKRLKRLIFTASFVSSLVAIVIVLSMFSLVHLAQNKSIDDLTKDITAKKAEIEAIPNLIKILTVQNQDNSLTSLHEGNPYTSRIFDYLSVLTPADVSISQLDLNMVDSIIKIEGSASDFAAINQYADTIKFATYAVDGQTDIIAFTNVATELTRNQEKASYTLTFTFDPILFNNTKVITLVVPNKITTRSSIGAPSLELFKQEDSVNGTESTGVSN